MTLQVSPIEVAEDDKDTQDLILLGVGVASLLAFLQANLTGYSLWRSLASSLLQTWYRRCDVSGIF
jgi:hypothetical protein